MGFGDIFKNSFMEGFYSTDHQPGHDSSEHGDRLPHRPVHFLRLSPFDEERTFSQ